MRRHASPAPFAVRAKQTQTAQDLSRVTLARQRPHRRLACGSAREEALAAGLSKCGTGALASRFGVSE
jgi:hypothetical protein